MFLLFDPVLQGENELAMGTADRPESQTGLDTSGGVR